MKKPIDPNTLPAEVEAFFNQIKPADRMQFSIEPTDAWVLIAIIQFAHRGPLPSKFKRLAYSIANQLITMFPPNVRPYLEAGWNPAYDQPLSEER